jgi:D-cysteine desulfhydrase
VKLKPMKVTMPTPVVEIPGFSRKTKLFMKRDDLNGLLISGNKARKMEYLIADAKRLKRDILVACGPAQSNHCRTAAAFARIFGFDCHLFLRGRPGPEPTGNLLFDRLLGAGITYVTPAEYRERTQIMSRFANNLGRKKAYLIPEGGSNEVGCLGYMDAVSEMAGFLRREKIDALYCAVGSGGTYAGLLLGLKKHELKLDLNGVIVGDTVDYFRIKILDICRRAIERFALPVAVDMKDISLVDGFVGPGYGLTYPEEISEIQKLARRGIFLDPVYTGKAFYGMRRHIKGKDYRKIVFIHTGGIFSLFAFSRELVSGRKHGN